MGYTNWIILGCLFQVKKIVQNVGIIEMNIGNVLMMVKQKQSVKNLEINMKSFVLHYG